MYLNSIARAGLIISILSILAWNSTALCDDAVNPHILKNFNGYLGLNYDYTRGEYDFEEEIFIEPGSESPDDLTNIKDEGHEGGLTFMGRGDLLLLDTSTVFLKTYIYGSTLKTSGDLAVGWTSLKKAEVAWGLKNSLSASDNQDALWDYYWQDEVTGEIEFKLSEGTSVAFRDKHRIKKFDSEDDSYYSYHKNSSKVTLKSRLTDDIRFRTYGGLILKWAADSEFNDNNYDESQAGAEISGFLDGSFYWEVRNDWESRDYSRENDEDSYSENRSVLLLRKYAVAGIGWDVEYELEFRNYGLDEDYNFDYLNQSLTAVLEYALLSGWTFGTGFEAGNSDDRSFSTNGYSEFYGILRLEYFGTGKWWLFLEEIYGRRVADTREPNIDTSLSLYDYDSNVLRLNMSGEVNHDWSWDVFIDHERRWYDSGRDDNLLASLSLTRKF
jgi:hypothetical protein